MWETAAQWTHACIKAIRETDSCYYHAVCRPDHEVWWALDYSPKLMKLEQKCVVDLIRENGVKPLEWVSYKLVLMRLLNLSFCPWKCEPQIIEMSHKQVTAGICFAYFIWSFPLDLCYSADMLLSCVRCQIHGAPLWHCSTSTVARHKHCTQDCKSNRDAKHAGFPKKLNLQKNRMQQLFSSIHNYV